MRRKATVGAIAVIAVTAVLGGVWLAVGREEGPWPPDWYIDPPTNRAEYAALRRRATESPAAVFPPTGAKLGLLRSMAVGATLDPGESRPTEARVYVSSGYVLALRGRFSTAGVSGPPGAPRRRPPFAPCVTLVLDPSTFYATSTAIGPCQDLSWMGESIELGLDQEPA